MGRGHPLGSGCCGDGGDGGGGGGGLTRGGNGLTPTYIENPKDQRQSSYGGKQPLLVAVNVHL